VPGRLVDRVAIRMINLAASRRAARYLPRRVRNGLFGGLHDRVKGRSLVAVARSRDGVRLHCDSRDVIQRFMLVFGVWEPGVTAAIRAVLRPGDTFVDIGANIGCHSLLASRLVGPTGTVVAVEPFPEALSHLRSNIVLNDARNIVVIERAVATSPGRVSLFRGPQGNLGKTSRHGDASVGQEVSVPCGPLADLLEPAHLGGRLLKVDVEGDENLVLGQLLDRAGHDKMPDALLLEISTSEAREERGAGLQRLRDLGYALYRVPNRYGLSFYLQNVWKTAFRFSVLDDVPDEQFDLLAVRSETVDLLVPGSISRTVV